MAIKGVDISEMNGSVDFSALKNAGVQFVIIRCGFGSDYTNQDDKRFAENVKKAEAAGMPWGAYLCSYATTNAMAKSEAQHTLRVLNGKKQPMACGMTWRMLLNLVLTLCLFAKHTALPLKLLDFTAAFIPCWLG